MVMELRMAGEVYDIAGEKPAGSRQGASMVKLHQAAFLILAVACSCLNAGGGSGLGPTFSSDLTVDTSFTPAPQQPGWSWDAGRERVFVLRWTPAVDGDHYVIRVLAEPIGPDNWDSAIPVDTVAGAQDTCWVSLNPLVYSNTCIGCGICVNACPHQAITLVDGRAVIDPTKCTSCGQCVLRCPVKAIRDTRMGQFYYFAIRAYSADGAPSDQVICTSNAYRLIYANDEPACAKCNAAGTSTCWAVINTPTCPVSALQWDEGFLVSIDYTKCIHCGWCFMHCNELTQPQHGGIHTIGMIVEALTQ
jgi:ferredoxin